MRSTSMLALLSMAVIGVSTSARAKTYSGLPEVSIGTNPHRNFSAEFAGVGSHTLLTVPDGQDFVITMFRSNSWGVRTTSTGGVDTSSGIQVLADGITILRGHLIGQHSGSSVSVGRANLRVPAGAVLQVQYLGPATVTYYLQGYLVQTGGPFHGVFGVSPSASHDTHTIFTTDADRDFLIRTAWMEPYSGGAGLCDLYVNGSLAIGGNSLAMYDVGVHWGAGSTGGLIAGNGALTVPGGSAVQVRTHGQWCTYYIDGEYITP